ncbi:hypothetical protein OG792_19790 [Micromonospora sp. NBC_01699]|uniref:nSTAND1 domain-containing NTPase n=1 Tax=Micromonospora sp. NBC_01699 TaxID=2975984 RepID=UPI002E296D21|nr:hypothetical protein [Micromonospora sp. NBC_01699]
MPRAERPLDPGDTALLRFARDLRLLREKAGKPTYRELSGRAHYSEAALSQAAAGHKLPSMAVTLAYVAACGGSTEDWEERWREVAAELPAPEQSDDREPPYAGLASLQPRDAERFFGRERLVDEVRSRLARQRVVVAFGASGVGKSSLLRAGVMPRLPDPVLLFTPGAHPIEECAIQLARHAGSPVAVPGTDVRALHRMIASAAPDDAELVIVVDQFEEVFTLCRDDEQRRRFIDALLTAALTRNSRCRVVLGVRADFYAHCTAFPDLVEVLRDGQVTVGPMNPEELRLAITQPAVRSGYAVETALLTELVAQANGRVGVLPMLSHVLLETWLRRRGNTLTLAGFRAAGGIAGALTQTAEAVYARLSAGQRKIAKNLLLRLTEPGEGTGDAKRRVDRVELDDNADTRTVLDRFAHARLVTLDRDGVEIAHEALLRSWPRLREWLAEDREGLRVHRALTEATEAWEALDHDDGALYRGVRLVRAREWAARNGGTLASRERTFLEASRAAELAEHRLTRQRGRRLGQAVALLGVLLVLAAAAVTYAVNVERSAARQSDTALSKIVAGKAGLLRGQDPDLAAQLSLAAYRLAPTAEARASLLAMIPFPHSARLSGHDANLNAVTLRADGRAAVTVSHDRTARLWDVADARRPEVAAVLTGHASTVNAAAFRPDGRVLATASWDGTAKLWEVADLRHPVELATLHGHRGEVNAVTFHPDGRTAVTVSSDRTAKVWNVADPRAPRELMTLTGHTGFVVGAAFGPDGTVLATASFDHTVALWNLAEPDRPRIVTGHRGRVTWVAFSADGTRLATASQDRTARVWDLASGRELGVLTGHDGIVRSVAFSPDGRTVATAAEDQTARLWDVAQPGHYRQVAVLKAHTEPVVSVAFRSDGRVLATASDDDTAILWKIPGTPLDQLDVSSAAAWVCDSVDGPIGPEHWATYFPGRDYRPPCRGRPT